MTAGDAEKALRAQEADARPGLAAAARPQAARSRARSRPPARSSRRGTPVNIFFPTRRRRRATDKDKKKGGRRPAVPRARRRRWRGGGAADIIDPRDRRRRRSTTSPRRSADLGIVPDGAKRVQRRADAARCSRPSRPARHEGRKQGDKVTLLVSGGLPEVVFDNGKDILRVNGANGQELDAGRRRAAATRGTRRGAPTARTSPTSPTARCSLKDMTKKNATAIAADASRRRVSRPRVGADRRRERARDGRRSQPTAATTRTSASAAIKDRGIDAAVHQASRASRSAAIHWAPDGKSILGVRRQEPRRGPGVVRHRALEVKKASRSRRPARLGHGQVRHRHSTARQGRASTRRSRRTARQLALVVELMAAVVPAVPRRRPGGLRAGQTRSRPRVRACKVAWRGDGKEIMVVAGRRRLLRGPTRGARARARSSMPGSRAGAERERRQPGVPAADARGLADALPELPPPARARGELLRQLRHAAGRRQRAAGARARATRRACRWWREMTIGRAPGSTLVLADPAVSRVHARISPATAAGRSRTRAPRTGTWLDGVRVTGPMPLHDGAKIRLGDQELRVERRRDTAEAGRTIVVRAGRERCWCRRSGRRA